MDARSFSSKKPEEIIADDCDKMYRGLGWYVKVIVGNKFQSGLPDRLITHKHHGPRLVEYKYAKKYSFTPAQWETFPLLLANGCGIWIVTAATPEEYKVLFGPPNVHLYMGHSKKMH